MEEEAVVIEENFDKVDIGEPYDGEPKKKQRKHPRLVRFFQVFSIIFLVIALAIGGLLIFHQYYYTGIFVNGTSMYPTLNSNNDRDKGGSAAGDVVDYGIIDTNYGVVSNVQRFRIVATYYPSDYDSEGKLISNASLKIKRVMVLPGETFYFDAVGDLFINDVKVEQTFFAEDIRNDYKLATTNIPSTPRTLGDDEFWVMGDNRGKSSYGTIRSNDCQAFLAPVHRNYILGILTAIEGTCSLARNASGNLYCAVRSYSWPRFF